jgi:hypothetical protein
MRSVPPERPSRLTDPLVRPPGPRPSDPIAAWERTCAAGEADALISALATLLISAAKRRAESES